jgi:site-specific DNA-methyltransferase (adenine-specific)
MPSASKIARLRAPRNRTITIADSEKESLRERLIFADSRTGLNKVRNRIICGDAFEVLQKLPHKKFDLLFADPPYNLNKDFGTEKFRQKSLDDYEAWLKSWLLLCIPLLTPTASIYICGDWRSSSAIQRVGMKYFRLQNRITWEREKGRGAKQNWKSTAEDIWFFTFSEKFTFNVNAVKIKRKVIAPYTDNGVPKDWEKTVSGGFRLTHPSNIWTDISVPFWSMPENTDHPTQKPEKLLAKIILASTNTGDLVLDPFTGSGTTAAAAKKLGRDFVAVESDENYCLLAQKRLEIADRKRSIQGYRDGIFWERNSGNGGG